jgi:hypothetical protein
MAGTPFDYLKWTEESGLYERAEFSTNFLAQTFSA